MAEGGINAALDTMGQHDEPALHEEETYKAGRFLACREAVHRLTHSAPKIVNTSCMGYVSQPKRRRNDPAAPFGGQTKKRTAFASASTGKQLMYTLATRARFFEAGRMIRHITGFRFLKLMMETDRQKASSLMNYKRTGFPIFPLLPSSCIRRLNGLSGNATGSVLNTGNVTASLLQTVFLQLTWR